MREKETDIAKAAVDWLTSQNWEVYQEVQFRPFGRIADIVAVNGRLVWVVECKTSLNLALLEQAYRWRGYANFISIAVPQARNGKGRGAAELFLKQFGIGKLSVHPYDTHQTISPKLHRIKTNVLKNCLNEHQKTYAAAGNADGDGRRFSRLVESLPVSSPNSPEST